MIFWRLTDPRSHSDKIKSYFALKGILIGGYTFIFFTLNYLSGRFFPLPEFILGKVFIYLGVMIYLVGFGVSVWAKISMGKSWGVPSEHNKLRQDKLITKGPFKYSRNPIYIGLLMILGGYGIALQSYFTFLVLIAVWYFWKSAIAEEELLEVNFKKDYIEYKKKVPRFF